MKKCAMILFVAVGVFACGRPPEDKGKEPPPATDVSTPDMGAPDNGQPDATCVPDCQYKICGDDGCGGVCGKCETKPCETSACESGKCVYKADPACCSSDAECDDNNVCTNESCVAGKCQTMPTLPCDDSDACTTEICDPKKGCVFSPVVCDEIPGFTGTCDSKTGKCQYVAAAKCTLDSGCDDSNVCTTDSCESGQCKFSPVTCDDGNECTTDACDSKDGSCVHVVKSCDDSDACTSDSCNQQTGQCNYGTVSCDDANACTTDTCDKVKGCGHTVTSCDDGNQCTTDSCDPDIGCVHTSVVCDDGDPCTTDACDPTKGCVAKLIVCDDGQAYTTDTCVSGKCVFSVNEGTCFTADDCKDGSPCTEDVCDPATHKCKFVEVVCNDGDPCTIEKCVSAPVGALGYMCVVTDYKSCDDSDACTADYCDYKTGQCKSENWGCDDGNPCTTDSCDTKTGCVYSQVNCDDGNACTSDSCDENKGCTHAWAASCCLKDSDCSTGYACVTNTCKKVLECTTAADCNDNSAYTEDYCANGACKHTSVDFAFQCQASVKTQYPSCTCEVWAFYGEWEAVDGLSCLKSPTADFGPGDKISATAICNSFWGNVNDPTGAQDSAMLEVNARVVCADHTDWIGGENVQIVDPFGNLVPLVELHQAAKGIGWQDGSGVWHGRNFGAQNGVPWCDSHDPPPKPCE